MGKPFKSELDQLEKTYEWAKKVQIAQLSSLIDAYRNSPLISVGSGGSLTVARFIELLHQNSGYISKGVTPLDLTYSKSIIKNSNILLLSAGGSNPDILSIFKLVAENDSKSLSAICLRSNTPLLKLSQQYPESKIIELDPPIKKDGFLATNSLIAYFTVILRAYNDSHIIKSELPSSIMAEERPKYFVRNLSKDSSDTWLVLYAGWGYPVATDIESKLFEGAIGNVSMVDYRNFAHGRHNWLARRGDRTNIIALITPDEKALAEKTLNLIPESITIIRIETQFFGPVSSLDLLIKSMFFIGELSSLIGIDPGKPKVPDFGRKLYHLNVPSHLIKQKDEDDTDVISAILKKANRPSISLLEKDELDFWIKSYHAFRERLVDAKISAAVLDYDGTLCAPTERYSGLSKIVVDELERLASNGMVLGIATGRGKSVGQRFREAFKKELWDSIFIGYYNGSDIAPLSDSNKPDKHIPTDESLSEIVKDLHRNKLITSIASSK